jgi:2-keto-4-pentenoate hydratase/2-oxohepta-3-ene-1,7-dioic acid hydratase in catechol pathway
MVTKDEIPNVQNLSMFLDVNGQRMQTGTTKTMIFGVTKLVSYVSQFMTLEPGDIITTGTPPGVGMGIKKDGQPAPVYLKKGDVMRLGIEGLGEQTQKVVAFKRKA